MRRNLEELHEGAWKWSLNCCGGNREESMDLLHDVYVKILAGRARFDGRSSLRTWLFGVIRMTARNHHRKARWTSLLFIPIDDETRETKAAPRANLDHCGDLIRKSIESLSPRQSEILKLVFYHDLTVEEAAGVQRISVGSARQHYARAKSRLREVLRRKGVNEW